MPVKVNIPWAAAMCGIAVLLAGIWQRSGDSREQDEGVPPPEALTGATPRSEPGSHPAPITGGRNPENVPIALPPPEKLGISPLPAKAREIYARMGASDPEERKGALRGLVSLQDPAFGRLFAETLRSDPSSDVRAMAVEALVESGSAVAPAALVTALGDDDAWVRDNARVAVQELGPELTVKYLRTGLASPNRGFAIECGDLLERVFGHEVPHEFWVEMAGP